jgi:hypothetical protein
MKIRGRFLAFAILAAIVAGGAAMAQAQEMKFWRIGTGGAGGTYFPIGGLIANAISNPPGARPCDKGGSCGVPGLVAIAVSTNASIANVNAIQAGQLDAGIAASMSVSEGYNGEGTFAGNKKDKIRAIASLYPEDMHLVLKKGLKLNSLKGLSGLDVGVGAAGSGTQIIVKRVLEDYGIKCDQQELGLGQSSQRLEDGQIDAFFYGGGWPLSSLIQLGSTKGFDLYKFKDDEIKHIHAILPFYVPSVIPAGAYENIKYDVPTVATKSLLITSADQPIDLIYGITKALWSEKTRELLDKGHAKGKQIRLETALEGVPIPFHPGAEKFYKEVGMIK